MGTYLSTPVLDKCQESGTDLEDGITPVSWGVVDMQGWRKSMEDAHVAKTNLPLPPLYFQNGAGDDPAAEQENDNSSGSSSGNTKVFAVFDGHGGPEVARFCQLYLVQVLLSRKDWSGGGGSSSAVGKASSPENNGDEEKLDVGKALVDTFHSLDRMIDDEARRQELGKLRLEKPSPGETRTIQWPIPPTKDIFITEENKKADSQTTTTNDGSDNDGVKETGEAAEKTKHDESTNEKKQNDDDTSDDKTSDARTDKESDAVKKDTKDEDNTADNGAKEKGSEEGGTSDNDNINNDNDHDDDEIGEPKDKINDESDEEDDGKKNGDEKGVVEGNTADTMSLFQRLLNIQGGATKNEEQEGEENDKDEAGKEKPDETQDNDDDDGHDDVDEPTQHKSKDDSALPSGNDNAASSSSQDNTDPSGPCASKPTKFLNGRQVCNLPDHPIHAGCTAVVAVLIERTVYVANAGDSRAVLCRKDGITEPLSFDHKPLQDIEMNRIKKAGGFVNQFGRVNGNLNLSRSIGDLKYKQVPGIEPAGQMITAEPDIMRVTLNPGDEFIILGCDGIWDCLTNEQAVQYVRSRIDTKTPTQIGIEMLDEIISDDPRVTQGIGGDNMTIMIIDLLPHTRSTSSSSSKPSFEDVVQEGTDQ